MVRRKKNEAQRRRENRERKRLPNWLKRSLMQENDGIQERKKLKRSSVTKKARVDAIQHHETLESFLPEKVSSSRIY